MYAQFIAIVALSGLMLLEGCSSPPVKTDKIEVTGGAPMDTGDTGQSNAVAITSERPRLVDHSDTPNTKYSEEDTTVNKSLDTPPKEHIVLFDFDSSNIRQDATLILDSHGAYLNAHPQTLITLEGHADERGTREYNLALGERRASATRQFLMTQGAKGEQLKIFSYGEERPIDQGQNEAAWAQNRRVEIVY